MGKGKRKMRAFFVVLLAACVALGAYQVHLVSSLPGLESPGAKDVAPERMENIEPVAPPESQLKR